MLDLRFIIENLDAVRENCSRRYVDVDLAKLESLDERRRSLAGELQALREKRNELARQMKGRKPSDDERAAGRDLKEREGPLEQELRDVEAELAPLHAAVPNMTHAEVPSGRDEESNRELRVVGEVPRFDAPPLDHLALAEKHDLLDFDSAARVTGQKFYYLKNELVLLEQAIVRYTLDLLREKGWTLYQTPDLARNDVMLGLGFAPRGEESNTYYVEDSDLVLVGTAEITLGGLYMDSLIDAESLPLRMCGLSHCFRTEAGAAGRAGKGLYRVHQFTKVEMFAITQPADSGAMHDEIEAIEEEIFSSLGIPFRVVDVCTGDLGAPAYRKFDLEAWMPGRGEGGEWGEVTSASNCTDYQARRLNVRYRDPETSRPRFCHMLNGTAISLARALLALIENHQQPDGSIAIPRPLVPYTGFERIG